MWPFDQAKAPVYEQWQVDKMLADLKAHHKKQLSVSNREFISMLRDILNTSSNLEKRNRWYYTEDEERAVSSVLHKYIDRAISDITKKRISRLHSQLEDSIRGRNNSASLVQDNKFITAIVSKINGLQLEKEK